MRRIIPLFLVLASGSANARPKGPCAVSILRAPPDVRATVESWDRETSCRTALEVRIVPTDGGLYLFARDDRERIYERIVPDAQSAGVLVASWMADDTMTGEPRTEEPAEESPSEPEEEESSSDEDEVPHPVKHGRPSHWLMLQGMAGATLHGDTLSGGRADLDIVSAGKWNFGVSASLASGGIAMHSESLQGSPVSTLQHTTDIKALIYATRQIDVRDWHLRPSFGLGALISTVHVVGVNPADPATMPQEPTVMSQAINVVSTMAEVSFVVGRDIGPSWAMHGGLALDLTPQNIVVSSATYPVPYAYANRSLDLVLAFGVGRRL